MVNSSIHINHGIPKSYAQQMHEIRNPLQSICSLLETLGNNYNPTEDNGKVKILKSLSDHLVKFINSELTGTTKDFVTIDGEDCSFDFREIITSAVFMYQLQCNEDVQIKYSVGAGINQLLTGNKLGLNQILFNLLGNAVKFTERGEIYISAKVVEKKNDMLTIKIIVSDSGIGIQQEKLQTIFNSGIQADSNIKRKYGGSGYGLSIVKGLVSKMGGNIEVNSEFGVGTNFSLVLSFKLYHNNNNESLITNFKIEPYGLGKRVFIVDDNTFGWLQTVKFMQSSGYEVELVDNAQQAIYKLGNTCYDIILIDLYIDNTSGFDIVEKIKKTDKHINKNTPIVMVSGSSCKADSKNEIKSLISAWVLKPFDSHDIIERINQVMSKKKIEYYEK